MSTFTNPAYTEPAFPLKSCPEYVTELGDADYLSLESNIADVQRFMDENNHTLVPIIDLDRHVFGVVSALDIIRFKNSGGSDLNTHAWEICSHKLITADINTAPTELARLFLLNDTHHILLTVRDQIRAIVSSMDLCRFLLNCDLNDAGEERKLQEARQSLESLSGF